MHSNGMTYKKEFDIGKAYGFFYCNASKQEIETELPAIRELVKTPSQLELLIGNVENLKGDSKLMTLVKEAKEGGIKYIMEAKYSGTTNKKTADELSSILNQVYQSHLYKDGEQFKGGIVYEKKGKYIFRE